MKFNEKIYMLRKKSGFSQDEIAEKLDVSRQSVSKWETGSAVPEPAKLVSLARIFSVSVDYLLDDSQQEFVPPQAKESPDIVDKIMSKSEYLFKNYGWILGIIVFLIGIWRVGSVVASISAFSSAGTFSVFGGAVIIPMIFSVLLGLAIAAGGIIMMKKLRKR